MEASGGELVVMWQPLHPCYVPVTYPSRAPNGYGNVTGYDLVTHTRTRVTCTHEPARVLKPVPITTRHYDTLNSNRSPNQRDSS